MSTVTHQISVNGYLSDVITSDMLGSNLLFHRDRVEDGSDFTEVVDAIGITHLRYPGGTIAEQFFDINDPNATTQVNFLAGLPGEPSNPRDVLPLSDFLEYSAGRSASVAIVLPTYRFFDLDTRGMTANAEADIKAFIRDLLSGVYGEVDQVTFELGNEYYQSRFDWTTEEFGFVQSQIAGWVDEVARDMGLRDDVTVLAQTGRSVELNETLAAYFEGPHQHTIDGVLSHFYGVNSSGDAMGIGGGIERRMNDINTIWGNVLGDDFIYAVTEWNVGEDGPDNTAINGMMRTAPLLRMYADMLAHGVDMAMIWAMTTKGGPVGLAEVNDGEVQLSLTGYLYSMLLNHTQGKQLVDTGMPDKLRDASGDAVGYNFVFADDNHTVAYFANGSGEELDLSIDLSTIYGEDAYVYFTLLTSNDHTAPTDYWAEGAIWHFTDVALDTPAVGEWYFLQDLGAYELIELHVIFNEGVVIDGDRQNAISDSLTGSRFDDELRGHLGDDFIDGAAGADLLDGGSGNDEILGGPDDDSLFGGDGDDILFGGDGQDYLDGGLGDDFLEGGNWDDTLIGGGGEDTLFGGNGDDLVVLGDDGGTAIGGDGIDMLSFAEATSGVSGWVNSGLFEVANGVVSSIGFEIFIGSTFDDFFFLAQDNTRIETGDGQDQVQLMTGTGNVVDLGDDKDTAFVYARGDNVILGGRGDDSLMIFNGRNTIEGGEGDDTVRLFNGDQDRFVFAPGDGDDFIFGFEKGIDLIELRDMAPSELSVEERETGTLLRFDDAGSVFLDQVFGFDVATDVFSL